VSISQTIVVKGHIKLTFKTFSNNINASRGFSAAAELFVTNSRHSVYIKCLEFNERKVSTCNRQWTREVNCHRQDGFGCGVWTAVQWGLVVYFVVILAGSRSTIPCVLLQLRDRPAKATHLTCALIRRTGSFHSNCRKYLTQWLTNLRTTRKFRDFKTMIACLILWRYMHRSLLCPRHVGGGH